MASALRGGFVTVALLLLRILLLRNEKCIELEALFLSLSFVSSALLLFFILFSILSLRRFSFSFIDEKTKGDTTEME